MYYSAIGLLAVMILLIENRDILFRRGGAFATPAWRAYRRFLYTVLVYYITDILWGVLESRKLAGLLFADTTVYFVAMAAGILCWTQYIVLYLEEKNRFGRFLLAAGRVLAVTVTLLACVNLFTPILFAVDKDCVYSALPLRYGVLAGQILLLLLISGYALGSFLRRKTGDRKKFRTLVLFGLIMAAFLALQLFYPYLPLYAIAYMLGTCLLRAFVIGDEKEQYRKDLEEAAKIRELKQSLSSLLDNIPGLSFSKDAETGVYLACNQAFAEYAHKGSPEGVVGLTDAQIFDPVTAKHFVEDDRMALSMDKPYIFFEDVPDAAGNPRQFQTTKLKFIDAAGRLCTLGICQDVTDLVRIQRENATTKEAYEKARSTGIMYAHIAQTLARDYTDLYYVNLETEEFIEYRTDTGHDTLQEARRGWHFFDECKLEAEEFVYAEDRAAFVAALDRRTLLDALNRNNAFIMTYRLIGETGPRYVSMKVSRMRDDENFIIIGVTDDDERMKQRRAAARMKEEHIAYARINALAGDILCVYVVVPETGRYREYSATAGYESLALPKEGIDFFATSRRKIRDTIYPEDLDRFLSLFTKEGVEEEIARRGIFALSYRLVINEKPVYVQLKAAMVDEPEGRRMVVGISDIDAHVKQEKEYESRLARAQNEANIDALTGVKNRHAYLRVEEQLDRQIARRTVHGFAIAILDVNDLKKVNDNSGHQAGDQYLRDACRVICEVFKRSPVFRVGGDEFAVVIKGSDYEHVEELRGKMLDHNRKALKTGDIVIACGIAKFDNDACVTAVFERADQDMYENKSSLKAMREG